MKTKAVIFIFIIVWLGLACSTGKSSKKKNNNTSPEVSIIYPSKGQIFFKLDTTSVLFKGKAIDTEDGELSGENLSWFISDILIGKGNSISISMSDPAFLPGDALIILKAVDSNHAEGSASVKIKIAKSHPEVRILSPINNSVFLQYETVHFSGNARDVNLNLMLYGEVLKWSSNKDNFLGYDSSFTTSSLSPGEHIIRFIATNRENVMDSAFIKIVINRPPTVNINSVLKKYYATTDVVNLNAFAEDPDEGILLNNNSFVWISAQEEGKSWIGHTIELDLSGFNLGEHILKIRATDSLGCSAYDSVSIITKAMLEYPQVKIKSPEQGTVFEEGDNIIFLGEGLDAEDGDLPEDVFIWTSVKDKKIIGTGKTITFSGLSIRYNHDIILEVHDSENNYSYDTVTIVVNEFNNSLIPVIISPRSGGNEDEKKQVLLKGYGTDYEDGVMADTSLRWQSSIDGFLGNYKEIFTGNLSSGNHILSLIAKDSKGKYGSTAVNFTINPSFWLTWTNGNIINCMAAEGNVLWAGTTGGLVRWNIDSKTYGKFTTVDGLINNNIKALAMDTTNKDLWIGTSSGLCKYSFETTWHFESYTSLTPGTLLDNDITSLTLDKNRKLWIGTSIGLNCYDPAVKAWQSYTDEIPHVPQVFRVSALDIDNNNELWIGTNGGGVARFDSARNNWTYYTSSPSKLIDNEITAISHDNAGNIWFGTYSSGVSKFNGNNLWTNYTSSYYGLINNSINSIMTDKYGKIWFGTLTGVSSLNNNSWKSYDDNGGLILNNNVSFITYDDNNNIYMGTNAGINKFAPDNNTWTFLEIE
ncbi:hypothetical protein HY745_00665, partial [Candidatus Desantisbacteria bacterium]|nr:hypothetical protein [Candidatus Desantisbacteria bacterium]